MIAIELCLPPKVNASGFERAPMQMTARGARTMSPLALRSWSPPEPGTPPRLVAAEQPAGRQDHRRAKAWPSRGAVVARALH